MQWRYDRNREDSFAVRVQHVRRFAARSTRPRLRARSSGRRLFFRGTIAEIRDSEIIFRVERVWKGHVPPVFAMPKIVSTAPCMPGFFETQVKVGAELLVYARLVPQIHGTGYVAWAGSRTALIGGRCGRLADAWTRSPAYN